MILLRYGAAARRLSSLSILFLAGMGAGTDLATATIFNETTVEDGPGHHLGFADYKAPVVVSSPTNQSANWKWHVWTDDIAPGGPDGTPDDVLAMGRHLIAPHPELGEVAPADYVFHWEYGVSPGDERNLTISSVRHTNGPHVDWLQMRIDNIDNGVSRIWFRYDHLSSGENPPPLPPRRPPTSISMEYFRGSCTVGALGTPCNTSDQCGAGGVCGVTATMADDTTKIGFFGAAIVDLYRGEIGPGADLGTFAYPSWILSFTSCWDPPFADWLGADTGFMDQTLDPNPPMGRVTYYDYTIDTGFGFASNVNDLGCSNPGRCRNPGWCEGGATPGLPCDSDAGCAAGVCRLVPVACRADAGAAFAGGCASHPVCLGGASAGILCTSNAMCPGSTCSAPTAPPGLCVNLSLAPGPVTSNGCPPAGDPRRVTRAIAGGVIVTCP